ENFIEVIRNQEFLLLPASEIAKLLSSDDINVPDEETIFQALMQWVKYDIESRQKDLGMLLSYIRLPLLPPQWRYLNDGCSYRHHSDIIFFGRRYNLDRSYSGRGHPPPATLPCFSGERIRCRLTMIIEISSDQMVSNHLYDLRRPGRDVAMSRPGRGCQQKLVLGWKERDLSPIIPITRDVYIPCNRNKRVAVLEGPMYAVGGHDGWSYLNTVERWDPQARQWNYVASMTTPRSTVGVAALNNK
ncbi:hypothetical protein AB205_0097920, partial [Aquarana catesbeiana]